MDVAREDVVHRNVCNTLNYVTTVISVRFFPFFNNRVDSFSQAACVSQSLLARAGARAKRKNIIILTTAFVRARLSFASLLQ